LLRQFRRAPSADIPALADLLTRLSQFAAANADCLDAVDPNPVIVLEEGRGVIALDAVVEPRSDLRNAPTHATTT
jgi:hypothetical protein